MRRHLVIYIGLMVLLVVSVYAAYVPPPETGDDEDPDERYKFDWYDVEAWEVEFCSKIGGVEGDISGGQSQNNILNMISQDMIMTLQAQKTVTPDGLFIYEFGYYLQPTRIEEQIIYEIRLRGEGISETVAAATAGLYNDFAGYYLERMDQNFTSVRFAYESQRSAGTFDFPIVEIFLEE